MSYLKQHGPRTPTPQSEAIHGAGQVLNSAGGHAWEVDCWTRLRRFLILGAEGGTYYATERELTAGNLEALTACLDEDGPRAVELIADVSHRGLAPRNTEALFALAAASGHADPATRAAALAALPRVARIGTHLFQWITFAAQFRGRGPAFHKAVNAWYLDRTTDSLALQLAKYQGREGWTHRDVLRLTKPRPERGGPHDLLLAWAVGKAKFHPEVGAGTGSPLVEAMVALHADPTVDRAVASIREHGLTREMLPSELLARPEVWQAFLDGGMPVTALIRNLANMTRLGVLAPLTPGLAKVSAQLTDAAAIRAARVHPLAVLTAHLTYLSGRGLRGRNTWVPVAQVGDALDAAFYLAFENAEPTGKRTLLALDVSGSMWQGAIGGVPGLSPAVGSAAMALVTAAREPLHHFVAFTDARRSPWRSPHRGQFAGHGLPDGLTPLAISPRQRLDDVTATIHGLPMGGTDCALPMLYALDEGLDVDTFVIYTDSETWAGDVHPSQALQRYRDRTGIPARLVVVGMTSNGFSIADPRDPGMLDVVGFDAAAPAMIAEFSAGRV